MGLQQDYIMKMIEELIQFLMKKLLKLDETKDLSDIEELYENNELYKEIKELVDSKNINEAENLLFEKIDKNNIDDFKISLLFYNYLNSKGISFLEENNFSREEIKEGILDISKLYGYEEFAKLFIDMK